MTSISKKTIMLGVNHKARNMVEASPSHLTDMQIKSVQHHKEALANKKDNFHTEALTISGTSPSSSSKPASKKSIMLGVGGKARGLVGESEGMSAEHLAKIQAHKARREKDLAIGKNEEEEEEEEEEDEDEEDLE